MSECAVCIASRRSVVDAILVGYELGFKEACRALCDGAGELSTLERPTLCAAHDLMVTKSHSGVVREVMGLPRTAKATEKDQ